MKKLMLIIAAAAVVSAFAPATKQAEARPQYAKVFNTKYEIKEAAEKKCGVCHGEGGKNKKVVSDYGKALAKALPMKNTKDVEAIEKAFDKAAEVKMKDGKTYGELLKEGKLPPPAEDKE